MYVYLYISREGYPIVKDFPADNHLFPNIGKTLSPRDFLIPFVFIFKGK